MAGIKDASVPAVVPVNRLPRSGVHRVGAPRAVALAAVVRDALRMHIEERALFAGRNEKGAFFSFSNLTWYRKGKTHWRPERVTFDAHAGFGGDVVAADVVVVVTDAGVVVTDAVVVVTADAGVVVTDVVTDAVVVVTVAVAPSGVGASGAGAGVEKVVVGSPAERARYWMI